jgi:diguanylate cyclase (GGDEF)-like protein
MAARYGGEEFVVLLPRTDEPGAIKIGERICEDLRRLAIPHSAGVGGVLTVSVGVASVDSDASVGTEALLANADRALYRAKEIGRNAVVGASGLQAGSGSRNPAAA